MSYYDHATAIAFKLGAWQSPKKPTTIELEIAACAAHAEDEKPRTKPSILQRSYRALRAKYRSCDP